MPAVACSPERHRNVGWERVFAVLKTPRPVPSSSSIWATKCSEGLGRNLFWRVTSYPTGLSLLLLLVSKPCLHFNLQVNCCVYAYVPDPPLPKPYIANTYIGITNIYVHTSLCLSLLSCLFLSAAKHVCVSYFRGCKASMCDNLCTNILRVNVLCFILQRLQSQYVWRSMYWHSSRECFVRRDLQASLSRSPRRASLAPLLCPRDREPSRITELCCTKERPKRTTGVKERAKKIERERDRW